MIDPRITKGIVQLTLHFPFFGFLCSRLQVVADASCETMMTDSRRLYYGPAFLASIDEITLIFVLAHEVMHCTLNHCTRRNGRDPYMWNIACDYVVNLMLREAGFKVPDWVYLDDRFKGMTVDAVFDILAQEQAAQQQQQPEPEPEGADDQGDDRDSPQKSEDDDADQDAGDDPQDDSESGEPGESEDAGGDDPNGGGDEQQDAGGDDDENVGGDESDGGSPDDGNKGEGEGEGEGDGESPGTGKSPVAGKHDPGKCGGVIDAAPEHDAAALAEAELEMEVAVRQATNMARHAGEGKLPGFIKEIVGELSAPQQDWRAALRQWASPSSMKDYTWARVSPRHHAMGITSPGVVDDGIGHIVVAVDDSASIDRDMLARFGGELQSILDEGVVDRVTVLIADDGVHHCTEYSRGDLVDFTEGLIGRGGTAFAPAFQFANERCEDVTGLVYFTDLDSTSFGPEPSYPVLWAGYEMPQLRHMLKRRMQNVPFGDCIELN